MILHWILSYGTVVHNHVKYSSSKCSYTSFSPDPEATTPPPTTIAPTTIPPSTPTPQSMPQSISQPSPSPISGDTTGIIDTVMILIKFK